MNFQENSRLSKTNNTNDSAKSLTENRPNTDEIKAIELVGAIANIEDVLSKVWNWTAVMTLDKDSHKKVASVTVKFTEKP